MIDGNGSMAVSSLYYYCRMRAYEGIHEEKSVVVGTGGTVGFIFFNIISYTHILAH